MQNYSRLTAHCSLILTSVLLASCGGGGSSSGDPSENTPPESSNGSLPVKITASRSGTLQASDADGDPLTFTIVTAPTMGTITSLPDASGAFTYEPSIGAAAGNDSFTFRVNDGESDSNLAAFTINLVEPAQADDSLEYNIDEAATVVVSTTEGVVENAINPIGEALTASLITSPANASAFTFNADGSFTYDHDGSETLSDTFGYRLMADNGDFADGTATITIAPVNDPPQIDTPVGCVAIPEANYNGIVSASDPELDLLSFFIDSNGSKGTATITNATTGAFQYVPNANETGIDSFAVLIDDNQGGQILETIRMNIAVKVMPMGDSITEGVTCGGHPTACNGSEPLPLQPDRIGYRKRLKELLEADGYSIDLVGTRNVAELDTIDPNGGYGYSQFNDFQSEGHGGEDTSFFSTNTNSAATWLTPSDPDIVLLHIGTNDFSLNNSPPPSTSDVESTVNNIFSYRAGAHVFVARIIGQHPDNSRNITTSHVNAFNDAVESAVTAISATNVHMVDQNAGFDYSTTGLGNSDFGDTNKHPSQSAYNQMASNWSDELTNSGLLEQCP